MKKYYSNHNLSGINRRTIQRLIKKELKKRTTHSSSQHCSVGVGANGVNASASCPKDLKSVIVTGFIFSIGFVVVRQLCKSNSEWFKIRKDNGQTVAELPSYLVAYDQKPPTSHTLNELAKNISAVLVKLIEPYLYQGDIAIFFSIANKGKTIASIQMAIDIATGKSSLFPNSNPSVSQDVIYLNFEMKDAQMKKRLSPSDSDTPCFEFPSNIDMRDCTGRFEDIHAFLRYLAVDVEDNVNTDVVIFIDTITDLCPSFFSKEAAYVLKSLRTIQLHALEKKGVVITFVIEGHTTKMHDWDPISLDSLKGGFNQANLVDSMFALGVANKGDGYRYFKALKLRNDPVTSIVDLAQIVDTPYLHFKVVGKADEANVLSVRPKGSEEHPDIKVDDEDNQTTVNDWNCMVSLEQALAIRQEYQPGVDGHGLVPTAQKFGLKYPNYVTRILDDLNEYLERHPEIRAEEL